MNLDNSTAQDPKANSPSQAPKVLSFSSDSTNTNSSSSSSSSKGSGSREKLMRGPEAEPRDVVYVYDYSKNKTLRMKKQDLQRVGTDKIDQVQIPFSMGKVPICTGDDGASGTETMVARVHVGMGLRLQRWLGMQKRLYIVDQV